MALQLSLVFRDETKDLYGLSSGDLNTLDLMPYLSDGAFSQSISTQGEDVNEAIGLLVKDSTGDALAADVQTLDAMLSRVLEVMHFENYQRVWLRVRAMDESLNRQACLIEMKRPDAIPVTDLLARTAPVLSTYLIGLKRVGLWENSTYLYLSDTPESHPSVLGGKLSYSGVDGDWPARLARLYIYSPGINECWMGLQTTRTWPHYMTDDFALASDDLDPIWNLHLGTMGDDASTTADATAQDGTKVVVTFATDATLDKRVSINAIAAGNKWLFGRYQVLLRARCTSTLSARVRLGHGFVWSTSTNVNLLFQQRIDVTTGWTLYPLGEVDVPSHEVYSPSNLGGAGNTGFRIDAAKISGSGNLELDCLVFIPTLDGYLHVKSNTAQASSYGYHIYQSPEGKFNGRLATVGQDFVREDFVPDAVNFGLRPGEGTFVFAAQGPSGNVATDALACEMFAYERWLTLRGAEGTVPTP